MFSMTLKGVLFVCYNCKFEFGGALKYIPLLKQVEPQELLKYDAVHYLNEA